MFIREYRFSEKVKGEPKSIRGQKRKFDPVLGDLKSEREKQLKLLDSMSRDKPIVNIGKAANRYIDRKQKFSKQTENSSENENTRTRRNGKFAYKLKGKSPTLTAKSGKKVERKLKRLQQTKKRSKL